MNRFLAGLLMYTTAVWPVQAQIVQFSGGSVQGGGGGSNIMPTANDVTANWQKAGVPGGIVNRTTQCGATVTPSGLTPPQAGDDKSKIQAAIEACTAGQFVLLGAGTFQLSTTQIIYVDQPITVRGSGTAASSLVTPVWGTTVQYIDGVWPSPNGRSCGTTTGIP